MRTRTPNRLAMVVVGGLVVGCLQAAPAGATPAGTWAIEGTTTVSYDYEGHHVRLHQPFATRIVVHDDGTIDGEVTEPSCNSSGDPVTFSALRSATGRAAIAAALRAFVKSCYGERSHLSGVRAGVRLSDDGTRLHGEFRARLRIRLLDAELEREKLTIRLHGRVEGRRDE